MSGVTKLIIVIINLTLMNSLQAIGHNGRIDMLKTVNHKEEIESLLNRRYTGDAAPSGGEIHHVKEIVNKENELNNDANEKEISRKALFMAAKNGM